VRSAWMAVLACRALPTYYIICWGAGLPSESQGCVSLCGTTQSLKLLPFPRCLIAGCMSDASEVEAPDWARAVPSAAPAEVLRRRAATRPTAPLGAHGSLGAGLRDLVRDLMAQEEPLRSHGAAPPARGPDAPQPRHTARRTERPAGREGLPAGAFAVPWRSEVLVDAPRSAGGLSREERAARDSARSRALAAAELALDLHYSTFRSGLHAARPERGEHREAVQEAQPAEGDWNGEQMLPFCDVHSDGALRHRETDVRAPAAFACRGRLLYGSSTLYICPTRVARWRARAVR
jgi:hypothetical protein